MRTTLFGNKIICNGESVITVPCEQAELMDGNLIGTGYEDINFGAGGTIDVILQIGSKDAVTNFIIDYTGGPLEIIFYRGPQYSDGVLLPMSPFNDAVPGVLEVKAYVGSTISDVGSLWFKKTVLGSGTSPVRIQTNFGSGRYRVLKKNTAYLIRVNAPSVGSSSVSMEASFVEKQMSPK